MWHIFSSRTKKKHIINFETKLASLLLTELPKVTDTLLLSNVLHISFTSKPEGIYVARSYSPDSFQLINRKYNQHFNLSGITVYHNKSKGYQPLKLFFQSNSLTNIIVDCPKSFHRDFDLNKIQKSSLIIEPVEIINPDQKIAEKALKSLSNEQLTLLDLDGTFEIELGGKFYYTILDQRTWSDKMDERIEVHSSAVDRYEGDTLRANYHDNDSYTYSMYRPNSKGIASIFITICVSKSKNTLTYEEILD
ncbi:MAG: hypothetical protein LBV59_17195 [Sphingobacterium sp.]|jgi:uncharacterized protein YxjI|uniref:hypothetical protein n=1 Tax=Sphingobacterium sp. TaxID=341027 RepID=UPI00283ED773|nr:hypothetical protein [Sphingobacterium sp.]MDR3009674.1 hypothetical protein [Sphingobacterium sp.]